jgi:sulfate/thiosulfate transport system substrate-binding protein
VTLRIPLIALLVLALAVTAGCGGASDETGGGGASSGTGGDGTTLSLVAYSTPQVVYDEIIPAFQKTAAGEGVGFRTSFGASGDQSRAV